MIHFRSLSLFVRRASNRCWVLCCACSISRNNKLDFGHDRTPILYRPSSIKVHMLAIVRRGSSHSGCSPARLTILLRKFSAIAFMISMTVVPCSIEEAVYSLLRLGRWRGTGTCLSPPAPAPPPTGYFRRRRERCLPQACLFPRSLY